MTRSTGQALLLSGIGLLTLAGVLLPFESVAEELAALAPLARLTAIGPAVAVVGALVLLAVGALFHAPRARLTHVLTAAAAGAFAGFALVLAAPQWLSGAASPVALLR